MLLTAQLSRLKWPQHLQPVRPHFFYKKAEPPVVIHEVTDGQETMEVGAAAHPRVFGKASPQIQAARQASAPGLQLYKTGGGGAVSKTPNPQGPLTFKYSRIGKGSQLMFFKN